jgi:phosphomevalonate kinase
VKRIGASAPGKALLCGEYAVLEGAPAVVAAVDRRVSVTWSDEPSPMPPEVKAAVDHARAQCGAVPGSLKLDVSALQRDHIKLGLGSSAAGAAAAAAAVFATHGHDLGDPSVTRRVFDCALEGHSAIAPYGSGVDVAASVFGGFLQFSRSDAGPSTQALRAPSGLWISLVWTGHATRTSELVAKVHELRRDDPHEYQRHIDDLTELASAFASVFENGSATEVVRAAALYARAMSAFGDASGAPIVEARLGMAGDLAARFSGSAKPCGAGGGDVAIAFFAEPEAAEAFELACREEGLHPIDVSWGTAGVRAC